MKRNVLMISAAIAVVAIAATLGMAVNGAGQGPGPGGGFGHGRGGGPGGPPPLGMIVQRLSGELALTDAQKASIEQIVAAERAGDDASFEEQKAIHEQLRLQGTDGTFNEAKVRELASQLSAGMTERIVTREKTKAQIFAVLTPEQRTKLIEHMQQGGFGGKRGHGPMGHGGN